MGDNWSLKLYKKQRWEKNLLNNPVESVRERDKISLKEEKKNISPTK